MKTNTLILLLAAIGAVFWAIFRRPDTKTSAASNQNFVPSSRIPQNPQLGFLSGYGGRGTDWGQVASAGASVLGGVMGLFGKKSSSTPSTPIGLYSSGVTNAQISDKSTWVDAPASGGSLEGVFDGGDVNGGGMWA